MKYKSLLLCLTVALTATYCSDASTSTSEDTSNTVTLTDTLFEPGSTVALQTAGGEKIDATATDTDGDGTADGLDFNADQVIEIEYALSVKSGLRSDDAVAFTFSGSDTVYYFLLVDGNIIMWTSTDADDAEAEEVTLVVDDDTQTVTAIALIDNEGNETTVELEVPIYYGETASYVAVSPGLGSTIGGSDTITVTLSESADSASFSGDLATVATYVLSDDGGKTGDTLLITPDSTWPGGDNLTLIIDVVTVSGNDFDTLTLNYDIDVNGPALVASYPVDTGGFEQNEDLYFQFDETITTNNLNIVFSFGGNYTTVLSTTSVTDDTLNIIVDDVVEWTNCGPPETIDIDVEDTFGNTGSVNFTNLGIGPC